MTYDHRPLETIEIPSRFKEILLKIAVKLDKKDIFEQDLIFFLDQYEESVKNDLLNWLKDR